MAKECKMASSDLNNQKLLCAFCLYFCLLLSSTATHTHALAVDLLFTLQQANWHVISGLPQHPTCKAKKNLVESTTFGHQTLILSHQSASHDMFLSIREVVFHVQGQGVGIIWEAHNTQGACFECRDSLHASLSPSLRLQRNLQGSLQSLRAGLFFYNRQTSFSASCSCMNQSKPQTTLGQ